MSITVKQLFIFILLLLGAGSATAGKQGSFAGYRQLTDKQILFVSTKGVQVVFNAYDNYNLGMECHSETAGSTLILPEHIAQHRELQGSIYIEELDELMQLTTTTNDGLLIIVDKRNFEFTFIDKETKLEIQPEHPLLSGTISKNNKIIAFIPSGDSTQQAGDNRL
ncbi:hypothetical protein [Roseimarinus sediminis]|uniref:hypothetical protein n=1 Tax=Roseimarinus sediminis TaxID=1610899 RepID=UPI003D1ED5EE